MLQHLNVRNELFWDVDPTLLDESKNKRLIIERVINQGNLQELNDIISFYGKATISETIRNLNYIDPKTLNFFALILNIPKSKFKCYIKKQSTNQHWTY